MNKTTRRMVDCTETSRRVAWAKYYDVKDERDYARWLVKLLVKRILQNMRLTNDDPLVILARELEKAI